MIIGKVLLYLALLIFIIGIILILYSLYEYIKCNNITHGWCWLAFIGVTMSAIFLILPSIILSLISLVMLDKKKFLYIPISLLVIDILYIIWGSFF